MIAFAVTAVIVVSLLFGVAMAISVAQSESLERLEVGAPAIKRWGGWILIGVGAWMGILSFFADFFSRIYPV